jgi:hypothetical protein
MARKRTKEEALARLQEKREELGDEAGTITRAAFGLASGLVMLDPFNRLADDFITIPIPMIAIPAHESHLLSGSPSMQIYIRAGETIVPTGGNVEDFEQGVAETHALKAESVSTSPKKKKLTAYQRKYKKAFAQVKPKHTKANGTWKKGGFKAAVRAAHRMCK